MPVLHQCYVSFFLQLLYHRLYLILLQSALLTGIYKRKNASGLYCITDLTSLFRYCRLCSTRMARNQTAAGLRNGYLSAWELISKLYLFSMANLIVTYLQPFWIRWKVIFWLVCLWWAQFKLLSTALPQTTNRAPSVISKTSTRAAFLTDITHLA